VLAVYRVTRTGRPLAAYAVPPTWSASTAPLRVPIGEPVAEPADLRNAAGRPAAVGEVGDLAFGAVRTGDRARRGPDGLLEFAGGCADDRGAAPYADPLEAVAALRDLPEVADALVTEYVGGDGTPAAVAYVADPDGAVDAGRLRRQLAARLPEYLVPRRVVVLERLPVMPGGDYDLAALPDPAGAGADVDGYVPPRTPTQHRLTAMLEELLDIRRVGITDSFFELGGFSLLATRLAARIREAFGVELTLRDVFLSPTVEGLAEQIVQAQLTVADADAVRELLDEVDGAPPGGDGDPAR
jgi:acyl carrier protein